MGVTAQNAEHHHAYGDRHNIYPRIGLENLERRLMFYAYHEKQFDIVDGESCPLENCLRKDNGDGIPRRRMKVPSLRCPVRNDQVARIHNRLALDQTSRSSSAGTRVHRHCCRYEDTIRLLAIEAGAKIANHSMFERSPLLR
jgi:hypothetical protein